ncbi:MAG: hypothetical protein PHT33_15345, partial [bacterium]|nr:hypothetical protein [bacterium]
LKACAVSGNSSKESMNLEVRVIRPYKLSLPPERENVYVKTGLPGVIPVTITMNREKKGEIRAYLEGFKEFEVQGNNQQWHAGGEKQHTFTFKLACPQKKDMTEKGRVIVEGKFEGGVNYKASMDVRATSGVVVYQEEIKAMETNTSKGADLLKCICLENEHLIARFTTKTAVLHSLVVRKTGMELLSPDSYPMGLGLYSWKNNWSVKENNNRGTIELQSYSASGEPVQMKAVLDEGGNYLDLIYDATGAGAIDKEIYLMSRIGKDGVYTGNVMYMSQKGDLKEYVSGWTREVKAEELDGNWFALADKNSNNILVTFFDIPALKSVYLSLRSAKGSFNYEIFKLKKEVPAGVMRFRIIGDNAGTEAIDKWKAAWEKTLR